MDRGRKAVGGLRDFPERLVGDFLSRGCAVRPDSEEHDPARAVQEGTDRLQPLAQLAGRALELQGRSLSLLQEPD